MLDLCLVRSPTPKLLDDRIEAPLGLLYLATYVKAQGFSVEIVDLAGDSKEVTPLANFYGFTTYTANYHETLKVKRECLKVNPIAKTIAGGSHATALPDDVSWDFDYVVRWEGEVAICDILTDNANTITRGYPIMDLDSIPFPDYSLLDLDTYHREMEGKRAICIQGSRGCPYACNFCNSLVMGAKNCIRLRSPENVMEEINSHPDIEAFRFQDDLFGLNSKWLKEFTELFTGRGIYRAFMRGDTLSRPGIAEMVYSGGGRHISIGFESGSEYIVKAMNKGETVAQIEEGAKRAKDAGLILRGFFVTGYPGETWETIEETIGLLERVRPHEVSIYPLLIYPGTDLQRNPDKYGITWIDPDYSHYYQVCGDRESYITYETRNLDRKTLRAMYEHVKQAAMEICSWSGESGEYV